MTKLKRIILALSCATILTTCISCNLVNNGMDFIFQKLPNDPHNIYKYGRMFRGPSPSARIYYDTGTDDEDEIDIFREGKISPTITLAEVYFPYGRWNHWDILEPNSVKDKSKLKTTYPDPYLFGPTFGFGITSPPGDAATGDNTSDAPVMLLNAGLLLLFPLDDKEKPITFGIEAGYIRGYSTRESGGDNDDGAWYVGLNFNIPFGWNK